MPASPRAIVSIASPDTSAKLSREQKTFNRLTRQVAELRRKLEEWQAMLPVFRSRHGAELRPLLDLLRERERALLERLDALSSDPGLTRNERGRIGRMICEIANNLLAEQDEPSLRALHDRHADVSFEEQQREAAQRMREVVDDLLGGFATFGVFDDDGEASAAPPDRMNSPHEPPDGRAQAPADEVPGTEGPSARGRPAGGRQAAREARLHQEATRSLREVYRKLASALHPDREPDAAERARKSGLMQQVNAAYATNDLLQLLELQIQAEQLGPADLSRLSNVRLKQYNKLLREQADELDLELEELEFDFDPEGSMSGDRVHPKQVLRNLDAEVALLQLRVRLVEDSIAQLRDIAQTKRWLKAQAGPPRRRRRAAPLDDDSIPF